MVSAAMRGFNHLMPMGCKQGKGFESSFQTSWLAPTWAFRYEARRDGVAKQCTRILQLAGRDESAETLTELADQVMAQSRSFVFKSLTR